MLNSAESLLRSQDAIVTMHHDEAVSVRQWLIDVTDVPELMGGDHYSPTLSMEVWTVPGESHMYMAYQSLQGLVVDPTGQFSQALSSWPAKAKVYLKKVATGEGKHRECLINAVELEQNVTEQLKRYTYTKHETGAKRHKLEAPALQRALALIRVYKEALDGKRAPRSSAPPRSSAAPAEDIPHFAEAQRFFSTYAQVEDPQPLQTRVFRIPAGLMTRVQYLFLLEQLAYGRTISKSMYQQLLKATVVSIAEDDDAVPRATEHKLPVRLAAGEDCTCSWKHSCVWCMAAALASFWPKTWPLRVPSSTTGSIIAEGHG